MNAPLKIFVAAVCAFLLGLPAARGDDYWPVRYVFIHFGTGASELTVSPIMMTLQLGELYRIFIMNPSENSHVVTASELAATGLTMSLLKETPRVDYPSEEITTGIPLLPGQVITWTFMPLEEGVYKLGCANPLHASAGMYAMIIVRGGA